LVLRLCWARPGGWSLLQLRRLGPLFKTGVRMSGIAGKTCVTGVKMSATAVKMSVIGAKTCATHGETGVRRTAVKMFEIAART
jgi:hypothetical protein